MHRCAYLFHQSIQRKHYQRPLFNYVHFIDIDICMICPVGSRVWLGYDDIWISIFCWDGCSVKILSCFNCRSAFVLCFLIPYLLVSFSLRFWGCWWRSDAVTILNARLCDDWMEFRRFIMIAVASCCMSLDVSSPDFHLNHR